MLQTIKILSWNIEHFKAQDAGRFDEVVKMIKKYNPDVFGLIEVENSKVYDLMLEHFPDYSLFLTTGQQKQEILIACSNKYHGIKFEQKDKFKAGNPNLRPGAFLTFKHPANNQMYSFLYLHTDSGVGAVDFGNRTEMFEHTFNLKRKLDKYASGNANFICLGDFNTMGLNYPKPYKSNQKVDTNLELEFIDYLCSKKISGKTAGLKLLSKPDGTYYSKNYGVADLDHVIASEHMQFIPQNSNADSPFTGDVKLDGWRSKWGNPAEMDLYTKEISDHCLLFCELEL